MAHFKNSDSKKVCFFSSRKTFTHEDSRRAISGVVGDLKFPFALGQIKFFNFSAESARKKLVVGNHGHPRACGQWEIIVVMGEKKEALFRFRCRHLGGKDIIEQVLYGGDVVVIPPGCPLAFVALKPNAKMLEISNMEFVPKNYFKEELF